MDIDQFRRFVQRAHSLQSLTLTFKKGLGGIAGLARVYAHVRNGYIGLVNARESIVILAVLSSSDWGSDRNRTIGFYGLNLLDREVLDAISGDIESIQTADHGAKGLMSGREKMRDEAARKIASLVLTPQLEQEVEGWGFKVTGQLLGWDEIPCLAFQLTEGPGKHPFSTIILDGWSGRMAVQGKLGEEVYTRPEQVQKLIRAAAEAKAESLTTA